MTSHTQLFEVEKQQATHQRPLSYSISEFSGNNAGYFSSSHITMHLPNYYQNPCNTYKQPVCKKKNKMLKGLDWLFRPEAA